MTRTLHFTVTTPFATLVDAPDAISVRAEDESGSFGVLPGHTPLLTVLPPSILRWRGADAREHYCAVGGGVMDVDPLRVHVACREAFVGDDLDALERDVAQLRKDQQEAGRQKRVETVQLEARALRRMLTLLRGASQRADTVFPGENGL
jgi:F-type H+-transporting ATPase subunit epsilon